MTFAVLHARHDLGRTLGRPWLRRQYDMCRLYEGSERGRISDHAEGMLRYMAGVTFGERLLADMALPQHFDRQGCYYVVQGGLLCVSRGRWTGPGK